MSAAHPEPMKSSIIAGRYRATEGVLGTFMRDEAYTKLATVGLEGARSCPSTFWGEGGAKRRMRAARPTTPSIFTNRGAGYPHPTLRATLSRRERDFVPNMDRHAAHVSSILPGKRSQFFRMSSNVRNDAMSF